MDKTWKTNGEFDPAPTALALIALQALGFDANDPAVARGVKALLAHAGPLRQVEQRCAHGFRYDGLCAARARAALPRRRPTNRRRDAFVPRRGESLLAAIARVRALSHTNDPALIDLMIQAASHSSPQVRFWGAMALGGVQNERGVPPLIRLMGDPVKMVRDASAWAMEQTLLDDVGLRKRFRGV